jgi:hypothetical protein
LPSDPGGWPYRKRHTCLLWQSARAYELHPIRDRALIESLTARWLKPGKQLHEQQNKIKFRNMENTLEGVACYWTDAGPTM